MAQTTAYSICVLLALHNAPSKFKGAVFVLTVHTIFIQVIGEAATPTILGVSLFFFAMWAHVVRRPPLPKQLPFNKENILLAFYTGDNGSFLMNLFQTMTEPVSSMCILSGTHSLKLKRGKGFQFNETHGFFRDSKDYYIIDTGVKSNEKFIENMRGCVNIKARKLGFRINCIFAIENLLGDIGEDWRPVGIFEKSPSGYFRKAYRLS